MLMAIMKKMDSFLKKYSLVSRTDNLPLDNGVKVNRCRFCNEIEPNVTFKEKTHLIAELLGENDIISHDECDTCNKKFGAYESHLAVFARPNLTLLNIKGKKSVPEFNSRGEGENSLNPQTTTILSESENVRKVFLGNMADYCVDEELKIASIRFRQTPFNPLKVYKAFVKIGLSLLPIEQRDSHENSFLWLLDQHETIDYIRTAFITTLKTKKFKIPFASLYQANRLFENDVEYPNHILIVGFANLIFQIYLPFSKEHMQIHNNSKSLSIEIFPAFLLEELIPDKFEFSSIDLSIDENVKLDNIINLKFTNVENKECR